MAFSVTGEARDVTFQYMHTLTACGTAYAQQHNDCAPTRRRATFTGNNNAASDTSTQATSDGLSNQVANKTRVNAAQGEPRRTASIVENALLGTPHKSTTQPLDSFPPRARQNFAHLVGNQLGMHSLPHYSTEPPSEPNTYEAPTRPQTATQSPRGNIDSATT